MIFKALTMVGFCSAVLIGAGALDGTRFSLAATGPTTHPTEKKEHHPEIRAALMDLRQAKSRLESGAHDFDGHRVAALKATQEAIQQCEQALKADKK